MLHRYEFFLCVAPVKPKLTGAPGAAMWGTFLSLFLSKKMGWLAFTKILVGIAVEIRIVNDCKGQFG